VVSDFSSGEFSWLPSFQKDFWSSIRASLDFDQLNLELGQALSGINEETITASYQFSRSPTPNW